MSPGCGSKHLKRKALTAFFLSDLAQEKQSAYRTRQGLAHSENRYIAIRFFLTLRGVPNGTPFGATCSYSILEQAKKLALLDSRAPKRVQRELSDLTDNARIHRPVTDDQHIEPLF